MYNTKQHKHEGQADPMRSDLQWLGVTAQEVKFGTIAGLHVCGGVIQKGPKFKVTRTGKPSGYGNSNRIQRLASHTVLRAALRDLERDIISEPGEPKLKVKIANGNILSWEFEYLERTPPSTESNN
jgi:hypothetical protein